MVHMDFTVAQYSAASSGLQGTHFLLGGGDYKIKIKIQTENWAIEQDISRLQVAKFILKVQILQC